MRLALRVRGVVQGVGFRPFVYREAVARRLGGWVQNRTNGVAVEVEGPEEELSAFVRVLREAAPPPIRVEDVEIAAAEDEPASPQAPTPAASGATFEIRASAAGADVEPSLPADLATCGDCLAELRDPGARRFRYPFTNCARCGPRYSIVERLPYDRARTAMKGFPMCPACSAEHEDPGDRRFHAEPIACPSCGPRLAWLDASGRRLAERDDALRAAAALLLEGGVLALRGIGGFQLVVDATRPGPVARLRERKHREEKPFAVLFADPAMLAESCSVSGAEVRALLGPEAPIVLVARRPGAPLDPAVAPGNPRVGAMLPATPLHHLLMEAVGRPVVCTSGNRSEEPMCIDVADALERLGGVADGFLVHDRPIVRPVDDSVARAGPAGLELLRRARGFAPLPVATLPWLEAGATRGAVLALGAQSKSTVALLSSRGRMLASQHLGDLATEEGARLLERTAFDLLSFSGETASVVACDLHPDYVSTRFAEALASRLSARLVRVQHHHAHIAAAMAEHGHPGPVLGFAWDGAGLGADGTIWGGEVLRCERGGFERVAHLRPFRLPGGDAAAREPCRAALGVLHALDPALAAEHAQRWYGPRDAGVLLKVLSSGAHAPMSSSAGRLFDAIAALVDVRARATFEGQAAMELEAAAEEAMRDAGAPNLSPYALPVRDTSPPSIDWEPLLRAVLRDCSRGVGAPVVAARFHAALAALPAALARRFRAGAVALSGGCFQNALLVRLARASLDRAGLAVLLPARVPANDGGVSVGQAFVAAHAVGDRRPRAPRARSVA